MSIQQKAVLVLDERRHRATLGVLRTALAKVGLKHSICTTHLTDISNLVHARQWPIVFIVHDSKFSDGLRQFERVFRSPGNQLFHYFLIAPAEDSFLTQCFFALGLTGIVRDPVDPDALGKAVSRVLYKPTDNNLTHAHGFALSMLKNDYSQAESHLKTLKRQKALLEKIDLARVFVHDAQNEHKKVLASFERLLSQDICKLRVLSDYAFFLNKYSIHESYVSALDTLRKHRPELSEKLWEQIVFYSALEKYNEIGKLVEKGDSSRAPAVADSNILLARIMLFMGLESHIPTLLAGQPEELRAYEEYKQSELAKGGVKQGEVSSPLGNS